MTAAAQHAGHLAAAGVVAFSLFGLTGMWLGSTIRTNRPAAVALTALAVLLYVLGDVLVLSAIHGAGL